MAMGKGGLEFWDREGLRGVGVHALTHACPHGAQGVQCDIGGTDAHLQAHLCADHVVSEARV